MIFLTLSHIARQDHVFNVTRDFHVDVDAIQQRAGEALLVAADQG